MWADSCSVFSLGFLAVCKLIRSFSTFGFEDGPVVCARTGGESSRGGDRNVNELVAALVLLGFSHFEASSDEDLSPLLRNE